MKTWIQSGDTLTLVAPYDRTSGQGFQVGMIFAVATHDALSGAAIEGQLVGVVTLNKLATDVVAQGDSLYWDDTNKRLTVTATANLFVGHATAAAGNGVATVPVRLTASSKAAG